MPAPPAIYLDHHATTPVDPRVVEAMLPYFSSAFGNPSSVSHDWGIAAREAVDRSRDSLAAALGARPDELFFTSGATEANNWALRGLAERPRRRADRIISVTTEHRSVLAPLEQLARRGTEVALLPVNPQGRNDSGLIDLNRLEEALRTPTLAVSVMLANNEIGALQPIAAIANLCRQHGALLHCDATQAVGKIPIDVRRLGIDLFTCSAHKFYGPKGIGLLAVNRDGPTPVRLEPLIVGGGQQQRQRGGTLNVPGLVGMARALELCLAELLTEAPRLAMLRERLWRRLREATPQLEICGPAWQNAGAPWRLPGNLNVLAAGLDGGAVQIRAPEIAISSGAACSADQPEPSHVLLALGLSPDQARSSLRFGLGRGTTAEQIDAAADRLTAAFAELRSLGGE